MKYPNITVRVLSSMKYTHHSYQAEMNKAGVSGSSHEVSVICKETHFFALDATGIVCLFTDLRTPVM